MTATALEARLRALGVVPVVVLEDPAQGVDIARALAAGGLPCAEITLRTPGAEEAIREIARAVPDVLVGAGTVVRPEQVNLAVAAGARFLVSPGLDANIVRRARRLGVPLIPGVATATEALAALLQGVRLVKLFPAELTGGVPAVRTLASVFAELRFVPTGGIAAVDVPAYLAEPSVLAVGGSWLVPPGADAARVERLAAEAAAMAAAR
jgi:2-dehydro-3-deoxyphosphogluconate aldolase / (4S)-4-hydroxy-2-oxoglutarate aldolase